jgi:hypothetical protein
LLFGSCCRCTSGCTMTAVRASSSFKLHSRLLPAVVVYICKAAGECAASCGSSSSQCVKWCRVALHADESGWAGTHGQQKHLYSPHILHFHTHSKKHVTTSAILTSITQCNSYKHNTTVTALTFNQQWRCRPPISSCMPPPHQRMRTALQLLRQPPHPLPRNKHQTQRPRCRCCIQCEPQPRGVCFGARPV